MVGGALRRARGHPVHGCSGCTHHIAKHAPLASGTINIFRVCAAASLRAVAQGRGLHWQVPRDVVGLSADVSSEQHAPCPHIIC